MTVRNVNDHHLRVSMQCYTSQGEKHHAGDTIIDILLQQHTAFEILVLENNCQQVFFGGAPLGS